MDYRELLLLRAARETGVLDAAMTEAGTPAEVADSTGVTERAARITLAALAEQGYLEQVDDEYEPTNRALGFLAKADVRSVGSVPHALDCADRWLALPETMRTGEPPAKPDDWTVNFTGAMATTDEATVRACVTAAIHRAPDAECVLDAGGGPGLFAREFARRGCDVTLVDRPEVVEVVRPLLADEPVELVAGDVTESLPAPESDADEAAAERFDLVFCSRVAHGLGPEENRRLLDNAAEVLAPGGELVLVDTVRGRADDAALFGAHMLAQTERGDTYTAAQFTDWLGEAGFEDVEIRDVPGTGQQAISGTLSASE